MFNSRKICQYEIQTGTHNEALAQLMGFILKNNTWEKALEG